ncbi:MAG: hypothetical protein ACR2H2_19570 [Solirubrobacteraceae bacterium]
MTKLILNAKERTGAGVIRSASGRITHVAKPLGAETTRTMVSEGVIKRVSAARKAAKIGR